MSVGQSYGFGPNVWNTQSDILINNKPYPGLSLDGNELNASYTDIREISGVTWIVNNAYYSSAAGGFVQANPAIGSSGVTLQGTSVVFVYAAAGAPTPIVWTVQSLYGNPLGIFIVTAYGAKFDGVTDDTAAWQACFNAAWAAGGGLVWAQYGTSVCNGAVVPMTSCSNKAMWIIGSGEDTTKVIGTKGGTGACITFQGNGGMRNMTIDGQGVADQCLWTGAIVNGGIPSTYLTASSIVGATVLNVPSGTGSAFIPNAYVLIDLGLPTQERVYVNSVSSNSLAVAACKFAHSAVSPNSGQIMQPVVNYQYFDHLRVQNISPTSGTADYVWGSSITGNTSRIDQWYLSISDCEASLGSPNQDLVGVSGVMYLNTKGNYWHDTPRNGFNNFSNWRWNSVNDVISNCGWPSAGDPYSLVCDAPTGHSYLENMIVDEGCGLCFIEGLSTTLVNCQIKTGVLLCSSAYIGHGVLTGGVQYLWPGNTLYATLKIVGGSVGYILNAGQPGLGYGNTPTTGNSAVIQAFGGVHFKPGNPVYPGSIQQGTCIQNVQVTAAGPSWDSWIIEGCYFDTTNNSSSGYIFGSTNNLTLTNSRVSHNRAIGPNAIAGWSNAITTDTGSTANMNRFFGNDWQPATNIPEPTVGASPYTYVNTSGYPVMAYLGVTGTTVVSLSVLSSGPTLALPITVGTFKIPPGCSLAIAYTGTAPILKIFDSVN